MHNIKLGSRLSACADYCRQNARIADIGTDHGHLPIYLIMSGRASSAIASDVNPEPLSRAKENVALYAAECEDITKKIKTILGNGLEKISPSEVDDIFIAGMGGELTADILAAAQWLKNEHYRLILQPMSKPEKLREWLLINGFDILNETPVIDNGRCYSVMMCEWSGVTEQENRNKDLVWLFCGRVLGKKSEAAHKYLETVVSKLDNIKKGAIHSEDTVLADSVQKAINIILEKINEE